ncbi:MAG: RNA 2'-phosphotransferase [Muribaculaceae bacterium]|nr:RNA 2'-phosphotransferase [Muribaculaceae bacterium]
MESTIALSRRLAYKLRHSSLPDRKGWVSIDVILKELSITADELHQIVANDNKGRFDYSKDRLSVRALYGHSIDVDLELEPVAPPATLYHGTAEKYIAAIMQEGLKPKKRKFVHLSETLEMAEQVGSRHGTPIVLSIDTEAMQQNGCQFYKAQNGIWLTGSIPTRYLKIIDINPQ